MIERGLTDYYYINISDEKIDDVVFVLYSHVGDADLMVSRKNKKPEQDPSKEGKHLTNI
jgi:hypothetical protein